MEAKAVFVDVMADGVAFLRLDLPNAKVNTLGRKEMQELDQALSELASRTDIKGLVLCSGKDKSFIAGADVNEIRTLQSGSEQTIFELTQLGKAIFGKLERLAYPTVAAINGVCLGGGLELALSCRFRLAAPEARLGLPEVKLGFIPGWGGCVRLPKLVGLTAALDLIMSGRVLKPDRAYKMGLVDEVVEAKALEARAVELVRGQAPKKATAELSQTVFKLLVESNGFGRDFIAKQAYKTMLAQTKGKYPAPKEALQVVRSSFDLSKEACFELESRSFARLATTQVSKNLVGIFFAQQESKRLPDSVSERAKLESIGVLGAGVMGSGIALAAAKAGFRVIVRDVEDRFLAKGKESINNALAELVSKKRMKAEEAAAIKDRLVFGTDFSMMADCDLVIEAIIEDTAAKQSAVAELEKIARKEMIIGSNTSSLSISSIGSRAAHPERIVGIHFFNPVDKMPLVEIVRTEVSSDLALGIAQSFALNLDKTTVFTADSTGFVVNRILAPYLREAVVLLEQGVQGEEIDKAMKQFGMPMGPLALLDEIGLDVASKVIHVMHQALGQRMSPPAVLEQLEKLQLLGKKGGKGIYLYDEKKKPRGINPDLQGLLKSKPLIKSKSEIQDRLVLLMVNEAARCLEEGVVKEPSQLDLAMIFGTGFAPFEGGVLAYADNQGLGVIFEKLASLAKVHHGNYEPADLLRAKAEARKRFYTKT